MERKHGWLTYLLPFFLIAASLVIVSWVKAVPQETARQELPDDYYHSIAYRSGADPSLTIDTLQQRLRSAPEDWRAYSQLGLAYLQKAREVGDPAYYPKAEGVLKKALSFEPGDYASVSGMGMLALARHEFQEGLTWGEKAVQINATRPFAYGIVADALIELGRYQEAVDVLQKMVDLRPDTGSYSRISYIRELYGDTQGAVQMMQWAVDSGGATVETQAWTRTQLGNLYFNQGQLEQAETEYLRTLTIYPNYVYALAGLGKVRSAQGKPGEAIPLLEKASQAMPIPEFVILLGDIYQANGQTQAADQQYELLRAIQKLYEANGVDLNLEIALFNTDHQTDLEAAIGQARKVYASRPSIHAADVLAWSLYQAGNYAEAWGFSQQALELHTQDALKLFHAGMICYRMGRLEEARDYLSKALQINPHFSVLYSPEAQRVLTELEAGVSQE